MNESPDAYEKRLAAIEAQQAEARTGYQIPYDANDPLIATAATWEAKKAAGQELDSLATQWNEIDLQRYMSRRRANPTQEPPR